MNEKEIILIIDDEPDFIKTMKFYLENAGFKIVSAFSGIEGVSMSQEQPNLILLDLKMPDMSGHRVCKLLKEDPLTREIPIMMLTSHDSEADKIDALSMGVVDYVDKDAAFEEILARIRAALRTRSRALSNHGLEEKNKRITQLKQIIKNRDIRILYEPVVDISTKKIIGYDTSILGPPGSPLESATALYTTASSADIFKELDMLCHSTAAAKAAFLHKDQILFLNIDPASIACDYFLNFEFLKDSRISPQQISLNMPQSSCIKDLPKIKQQLAHYRSLEVKIAITGVEADYSGLQTVKKMGPNFVTIDKALICSLDFDGIKKDLVQVISKLANEIDCKLIAEGVEAEYECKTLLSLGVLYGKGRFFGKQFEKPSIFK